MFLHTQTYGLAVSSGTYEERCIMVETLNDSLPTAFFHLDRWWGLERQEALLNDDREPWTRYHHVFTADGGHDDMWKQIGVNHHWLPPAVYHAEAIDGTPRRQYECDVAFVGSWRSYAHVDWWLVRKKMIDTMTRKFGRNFRCYPKGHAIRGMDLTDLYASVKVVVGDSCLVPNVHGGPIARYWSDRIPETMGRGGLLVHPFVHGLPEVHPHLVTAGDLDQLIYQVSHLLQYPDDANHIRALQSANTRDHHTYRNRMTTLLETVLGD